MTRLIRLWLVTLAANLAGGIVMAAMIVYARPDLRATAEVGRHYATLGVVMAFVTSIRLLQTPRRVAEERCGQS